MHFYAFFIKVGRLTLLYTCIMTIAHLCITHTLKHLKMQENIDITEIMKLPSNWIISLITVF